MADKAETLGLAARMRDGFAARGARVAETPVLQPADALLDLYGEDIRGRAYVTWDPLRGECMLRPDFTVPVAQMHMAGGASEARYAYAGEVFRRQEADPGRASEYVQAGFEIFGGSDSATDDAEAFMAIRDALGDAASGLEAVTGDVGTLLAAVDGLSTTVARKNALKRHIWRPKRFRSLLERFSRDASAATGVSGSDTRAGGGGEAPEIGKRRPSEVEARLRTLEEDSRTPPISASELEGLDRLLSLEVPLPDAPKRLREIARLLPAMETAVEAVEARIEALRAAGADVGALRFEGGFGRTSMEYYDGFVFEFHAPRRPDLPPLATGGRYDALTRILGDGEGCPAVGGVLRPDAILDQEAKCDAPSGRDGGGGRGGARARSASGSDLVGDNAPSPAPLPRAAGEGWPGATDGPGTDVRIGLPSKGRMMEAAISWFGDRGVVLARAGSERDYAGAVEGLEGVSLLFLAASEIPRELASGRIHLGVTGRDLVREALPLWQSQVEELAELDFGEADLSIAVPAFWEDVDTLHDLDAAAAAFRAAHGHRLRIATKYHRLVREFLSAAGVADYALVDSRGATEGVVRNETAEAVADISTTGATLAANGLKVLSDGLVLESRAVLWRSRTAPLDDAQGRALESLANRLRS